MGTDQLLPAPIASEAESGYAAVSILPERDPEWADTGTTQPGEVRPPVVDQCSPAGNDFLSEDEPGILEQMQLLTGF